MPTAIPPRTSGIERMRGAQPAGRRDRPLPGVQLSGENARQNALDNAQFDKQALEYSKPTTTRPALIVESEIEQLRSTLTLGSARLTMLTKVANIRHSAWQVMHRKTPLDVPNRTDQAKAEEFFKKYGERLADAPRVAPENPIKAKAAAPEPTPASVSRAEAARRDAEAKTAAAAVATPPAKDTSTHTSTAAKDTSAPPAVLHLLTQLAEQGRAQAKQITELRGDVKRLADLVAAAPASLGHGTIGEIFTEFVMDTLVVGYDDKSFETTYKARGPQYKTHGVRVWPEILPELGLDEAALPKVGPHKLPKPLKVRALMTPGEDGKLHPKKVVGLAKVG